MGYKDYRQMCRDRGMVLMSIDVDVSLASNYHINLRSLDGRYNAQNSDSLLDNFGMERAARRALRNASGYLSEMLDVNQKTVLDSISRVRDRRDDCTPDDIMIEIDITILPRPIMVFRAIDGTIRFASPIILQDTAIFYRCAEELNLLYKVFPEKGTEEIANAAIANERQIADRTRMIYKSQFSIISAELTFDAITEYIVAGRKTSFYETMLLNHVMATGREIPEKTLSAMSPVGKEIYRHFAVVMKLRDIV